MPRKNPSSLLWTTLLLAVVLLAGGCAKRVSHSGVRTEAPVAEHSLKHRVAEGETLSRIADHYYGDPAQGAAIARANGLQNPDQVVPGSVLILKFDDHQWQVAQQRAVALEAYNKGVEFMSRDRLAEAEKQFRIALDTVPDLYSAQYDLALVLSRRGKNSAALVRLEDLCQRRPADTDFRFARGHCLFLLTRFSEATEQFRQVLRLDPRHRRAAFGLARSLQEENRLQEAAQAWEAYLELDSTSSWAETARRNLQKLRHGS